MSRLWLVALLASGCVVSDSLSFQCQSDTACGSSGHCLAGACAFVAADCPSGFRYDSSANQGRSKQCVAADATGDLGAPDLAMMKMPDLIGLDLFGVDLTQPAPPDLSRADLTGVIPPDMTCIPTGAEDCYNGVDDDCDGLVDCADPDCSTSIAECVEAANGFQLGITLAVGTACPAGYTDSTSTLSQGLSVPGGCSGCDCSVNRSVTCSTTLKVYPAASCPGTLVNSYAVDSASCVVVNVNTNNAGTNAIVATGSCGVPNGTPSPPPISWTSQTKFCQTLHVGAGCSPGNVCVPKKASGQRCILSTSGAGCVGNYAAQQGGTWFTGATDTRDCGALCFCNKQSDGTCPNAKTTIYTSSTVCSGTSATLNPQVDACGLPATYLRATVVPGTTTLPSCTVGNTVTGSASATGQSTLCCLP